MLSAVVLATVLATASANGAVQLSNTLERREPLSSGGWALAASSCPGGTSVISANGFQGCCPTTYQNIGRVCCPSNTDCSGSLATTPYCANTGWILWNSTTQPEGTGYFCCLDGLKGTDNLTCVENGTSVAASSAADRLGRPEPSGVTLGAASSATAMPSTTTTTTSTVSSTTSSASASATTQASGANSYLHSAVGIHGLSFLSLSGVIAALEMSVI